MKRTLLFISIAITALFLASCDSNDNTNIPTNVVNNPKSADKSGKSYAEITFEKTEHDFGKLLQGETVSYTFKFTNTGNAPLIISAVNKSCGCTASEYTQKPIAPGEGGQIKLTYESNGHEGFQNKTVTVVTNTNPSTTTLRIKAEVAKPNKF